MFSLPAALNQLPLWSWRIGKGLRDSQTSVYGNNKRFFESLGLQGDKARCAVGDLMIVKLASDDPKSFFGGIMKAASLVTRGGSESRVILRSTVYCALCDAQEIESCTHTGAGGPEGKDSDSCCAPAKSNKTLP